MKLRDYKHKVRDEIYDIPEVYNKIKTYVYSKECKPYTKAKFNYRKLAFVIIPLLIIVITLSTVSLSSENYDDIISIPNGSLTYFTNNNEINTSIKSYREDIKYENKTSGIEPSSIFDNYRNLPSINIYGEDEKADIIKTDGNLIYYVSTNSFNIIKTVNGEMELIYSNKITNNTQSVTLKNELYIIQDYVIIVSVLYEYNFKNQINVNIYNKNNFSDVYSYTIFSNYVGTRLINNKLYLVSYIDFSSNNSEEIPYPEIYENNLKKEVSASNISYIDNEIGEYYNIITTLNIENNITSYENILLTNIKWHVLYTTNSSFYLINNRKNKNEEILSIIKYKYNNYDLKYSSSFSIKGQIFNTNAINEYNGYLRIALTTIEANIFDFTARNITFNNQIIILKETYTDENNEFKVVGLLNFGNSSYLYNIKQILMDKNEATLVTKDKLSYSIYNIDLSNPTKPKIKNSTETQNYYVNLFYLNEFNAVSFDKIDSGELKVLFHKINNNTITKWQEFIIDRDFLNQQNNIYLGVKALENRKEIYYKKIDNTYYFGFSIYDYISKKGNYLLFMIDINNLTFQKQVFDHQQSNLDPLLKINRLISIDEDQLYYYTISEKLIKSYNQDFIDVNSLNI